ncbi:hypothetical protein L7F22_024584 [Adiantum nelumboides]|nr:hypothetical protein [Adiantum nelumboides]
MKTPDRHCKKRASPMDTQAATAIVERSELPLAINLSKAGDLPESEWLTVFDTPKYKGSKIFLNMVKPQFVNECRLLFYRVYQELPRNNEIYLKFATCFVYRRCSAAKADPEAHKIAWALFAENVILRLKRNPVAWKRKVDAFRDTHGPINVITIGDSMPGPSMQADVKGTPEPCFMSSVIKKLHAKILDIQSNTKAKVLKNVLKEKKAEFLNKRDALIRRETTASVASMIQTEITSLQTRYGALKEANATVEQLAAVEAQVTAMSNVVKLIEGDDKIADMKIDVESIEISAPNINYSSPSGAKKSWSDREVAKNVGHDTVPEPIVLGATSEEGVEAILGGNTDTESVFLVEFVKRFKSNKCIAPTTAPREDKRKPCAQPEEFIIRVVPKVVPSTVQTNQTPGRSALLVDLNGVLVHTFCPHLKEQPPDLDSNDHSLVKEQEQYSTTYVCKDAARFLAWASQIADVYIWSLMTLCNLEQKLECCLSAAIKCLNGWLGQECCEVASLEFPGGKPVFLKPLCVFFKRHSGKYHEGNTLAIDDSWYKHMHNRTSTYVILPNKKADYMVDRLLLWLEQWVAAEDRAGFVKSWEEPSQNRDDSFVTKNMEGGWRMRIHEDDELG